MNMRSNRLPIGTRGMTTGTLCFVNNNGQEIRLPGGLSVEVMHAEQVEPNVWLHSITVLDLQGAYTDLGYDGAHNSDIRT